MSDDITKPSKIEPYRSLIQDTISDWFSNDFKVIDDNMKEVYNGYLIYELRDEKSLRYLVEAVADDVKYDHYFKNYPSDLLNLSYEEGIREKVSRPRCRRI